MTVISWIASNVNAQTANLTLLVSLESCSLTSTFACLTFMNSSLSKQSESGPLGRFIVLQETWISWVWNKLTFDMVPGLNYATSSFGCREAIWLHFRKHGISLPTNKSRIFTEKVTLMVWRTLLGARISAALTNALLAIVFLFSPSPLLSYTVTPSSLTSQPR